MRLVLLNTLPRYFQTLMGVGGGYLISVRWEVRMQ